MSRIIPPKESDEELVTTSFRFPRSLLADLDRLVKETGYRRTDVVLHLLRWAVGEYDAEKRRNKK